MHANARKRRVFHRGLLLESGITVRYVKVVFLKEVGAFVGKDGNVYGPYKPKDEAIIPEEDARSLALQGAVAIVGGYVVEEVKPLARPSISPLRPFLFMSIGIVLMIVGSILMAISSMGLGEAKGFVTIFPLPPIVVSGLLALLIPVIFIVLFLAVFLLMFYYMLRGFSKELS
jgi:hypothetical protein